MLDHELAELNKIFREHTENDKNEFHKARDRDNSISEALRSLNAEIKQLRTTLKPISDAYNGFLFSKSFITGFASVMIAIGAMGGSIIALVRFLR